MNQETYQADPGPAWSSLVLLHAPMQPLICREPVRTPWKYPSRALPGSVQCSAGCAIWCCCPKWNHSFIHMAESVLAAGVLFSYPR